jgi:putative transposon-encoded protein
MKIQKKKGLLILEQISFNDAFKKKVIRNNDTSGKITVSKDLIGKEVYIVVP